MTLTGFKETIKTVRPIQHVVKGCHEIAKIHSMEYLNNLKEWADDNGDWLYKIGFSEDNRIDPKVFFGDGIDESKDLELMSIVDYDVF